MERREIKVKWEFVMGEGLGEGRGKVVGVGEVELEVG